MECAAVDPPNGSQLTVAVFARPSVSVRPPPTRCGRPSARHFSRSWPPTRRVTAAPPTTNVHRPRIRRPSVGTFTPGRAYACFVVSRSARRPDVHIYIHIYIYAHCIILSIVAKYLSIFSVRRSSIYYYVVVYRYLYCCVVEMTEHPDVVSWTRPVVDTLPVQLKLYRRLITVIRVVYSARLNILSPKLSLVPATIGHATRTLRACQPRSRLSFAPSVFAFSSVLHPCRTCGAFCWWSSCCRRTAVGTDRRIRRRPPNPGNAT